jgi:hypothetical protein
MTIRRDVVSHGQSTHETNAASLTVPERVLLFCLASGTDWAKAGVPAITVQHLLVRNLAERDDASHLVLTEHGRAVLAARAIPPWPVAVRFIRNSILKPRRGLSLDGYKPEAPTIAALLEKLSKSAHK